MHVKIYVYKNKTKASLAPRGNLKIKILGAK
jgi:hypothetical protein